MGNCDESAALLDLSCRGNPEIVLQKISKDPKFPIFERHALRILCMIEAGRHVIRRIF
jgi:hypothetical protein